MLSIETGSAQGYDQNKLNDFIAKVNYSFNPTTQELTVTDASTIPSGDTFKIAHIEVHDKFGGVKRGSITALAGNVVIDLDAATALNLSKGVVVSSTTVTTKGLSKDGSVRIKSGILANAGSLTTEI